MMSSLDAVLAQYEKAQQGGGAQSKMSQDERMKKYFALILSDKEKSGQRRVRILPTHDGSSPFKEAWYHEIQVGGQWQKFYDPGKNDNERSPLNEVYEELMATGKESDKELAKQYKVPLFSSSSLRYMETAQQVAKGKIGKVLGADCFSPATLEKTHPDFFWYGIHGVELLYTVMGMGCLKIKRTSSNDVDVVVGEWSDGRIGTFRGTRNGKHEYGGTAYGENGNLVLGPFQGYDNLLQVILQFFQSGTAPISSDERVTISPPVYPYPGRFT